jgi:pSer/pThr/pTyr-binding forkhead associated (FHA) protein
LNNQTIIYIQTDKGASEERISLDSFYIGRSDISEVVIQHDLLSRKHIKVKICNDLLSIQDLDTTNGTFLNDERLESHEWYEVLKTDEIRIGNGKITLNLRIDENTLEDDDSTAVINLDELNIEKGSNTLHFASNKTAAESMKQSNQNDSTSDSTRIQSDFREYRVSNQFSGNAAIKDHSDLDEESFSPAVEGNLKNILNKVDSSKSTEFSEIELLEIKKIEIESQVKALKIKEESELEAKRLIEKSLSDAQIIIDKSNNQAQLVKNEAQTEADIVLSAAKREASEITEKAQVKLKNINEERAALEVERDGLREKIESLHEKVSESLEQKNSYEIQSDNLKKNIVEEKDKVKKLIIESEETSLKVNLEINGLQDRLSQLYFERDEATAKLEQQNRECFSLQGQKDIVESEITDLKNKENNLQSTIEKHEERVDKFYKDKESLILENKSLEDKVSEFNLEITKQNEDLDKLRKTIVEKEDYLKNIENKAQNYYLSEKEKYDVELSKIRSDDDKNFKEKISENKIKAKEVLDTAYSKAEKLELEASELFRIAEEKEKEAIDLENTAQAEFKKQHDKVNEELLRKLHDANVEAKATRNNALSEYEDVLVNAKEKAESIELIAQEKSDEQLEKAKNDAKEIYLASKDELIKAQDKATEVISYANDKAAKIHQEGLKELEGNKARLLEENNQFKNENDILIKEKEEVYAEIEDIKNSIDKQKLQFKENMTVKREEVLAQAKVDAEQIIASANKELADAKENSALIHKTQIEDTETQIKLKKEQEGIRLDEKIKREKELLAKLRTQEMENHKVKREQEEAELKNRKEQYADSIVKGIENLVNTKLQEMSTAKVKSIDTKIDSEKIAYLVRASLLEKNPQNNELLKKLNPYGNAGKGKSTLLMKRIVISLGVIVSLLLVNTIFPTFYSGIGEYFGSVVAVEESAKDLYLKDLQEKRDKMPRFNPKQTDSYKKSYTDNIIYTARFKELWPTDALQKEWTIKVDEIIVYKLKLKDYKVVKYISEEFKLVRNLINMSKKIKLKTEQKQIEEMRIFEKKYRKRLIDLMNGKKNLKQMHSEQKKFFINYKQKNPMKVE